MDNSGLNTVLLLVVILALVAGAVWFFTAQESDQDTASIEVTLPIDGGDE